MFTGTAYRRGLRTAIGGNALAVVVALSGCGVGDRLGPNRLDAGGYTRLMRAAESGDLPQIRLLTKAGADPNYQGRLVKHYSILFPFVNEEMVNVPRDSWTPLIVAALWYASEAGQDARGAGLEIAPVIQEIAAMSSNEDKYGMGSTSQMLLRHC